MGTIDYDRIDFEKLRKTLEAYFKKGIKTNPFAVADDISVDRATNYQLVTIAIENGFEIEKFQKKEGRTRK